MDKKSFLLAIMVALPLNYAHATMVTEVVSFSANSFQSFPSGAPSPTDPVTGSFYITFDPTQTYTNNTTNISLKNLNIALGSSLSFSYSPTITGFPAGTLRVGGLFNGSDAIQYSPATNDLWLYINNFNTNSPQFQQVGYSQVSLGNYQYYTVNQTGSVTVSPVPLPASLSLFASAIGMSGLFTRWRKRRAAALVAA